MIEQILKMIPKKQLDGLLDGLADKIEDLVSYYVNSVPVKDGERAAVLLIEGTTGYMVNVIRLDENLSMTIVNQQTLKEFTDNILKFVKDGNLG